MQRKFQARDEISRRQLVPWNDVPLFTTPQMAVANTIAQLFRDQHYGRLTLACEDIGKACFCSVQTVYRAMSIMRRLGLIVKVDLNAAKGSAFRPNDYDMSDQWQVILKRIDIIDARKREKAIEHAIVRKTLAPSFDPEAIEQ